MNRIIRALAPPLLVTLSFAAPAVAKPMVVQNVEQTEAPDGQGGTTVATNCETFPLGGGYKTVVETSNGAQYALYGWQVAEDDDPEPVNADSWVRTGDATRPQDRRVTWCHVAPLYVQVQTKDGSNFRIYDLTVG